MTQVLDSHPGPKRGGAINLYINYFFPHLLGIHISANFQDPSYFSLALFLFSSAHLRVKDFLLLFFFVIEVQTKNFWSIKTQESQNKEFFKKVEIGTHPKIFCDLSPRMSKMAD